jgi:hypothetical protein
MIKKLFLISLLVLAFSVSAFAGEGSDTIGACKLLPELRYAYYETPVRVTEGPTGLHFNQDWRLREHNVTLQVNYGLSDDVDVFAFAGGRIAAEKSGTYSLARTIIDQESEFDLGSGFIGGVGIKGTFYRAPNGFYFGGGMSFTYAFTGENIHLKNGGVTVVGTEWRETDAAATADLHAGWHIRNTGLTPYLGVEYRWNQEDLYAEKAGKDFPASDYTTQARNPFGVYVGLDYLLNNRVYFNVEGQMIKRWGGSLSVGYLFDLCPVPVVVPPPVAPPIEPKLEPMSFK